MAHLSWCLQMIFQLVVRINFDFNWCNHNLSTCQKETFILIHPHPCQSFPTFMCKYFLVRQSQRKFANPSRSWHEWPAGADVEVPRCQMQILKQYPRYAWLRVSVMKALIMIIIILSKGWLLLRGTPRIPNHQSEPPMNHLLRYWGSPDFVYSNSYFGWSFRSWIAWVAAHWRSKGHQRVGYPHSCPNSSNIFWGNQFFCGAAGLKCWFVIEKGKGKMVPTEISHSAQEIEQNQSFYSSKSASQTNIFFVIPLQTAVFPNSVLWQVMLKCEVVWDVGSWEAGKQHPHWMARSMIAKINVKTISAYWYQNSIKKQNEIMFSCFQDCASTTTCWPGSVIFEKPHSVMINILKGNQWMEWLVW